MVINERLYSYYDHLGELMSACRDSYRVWDTIMLPMITHVDYRFRRTFALLTIQKLPSPLSSGKDSLCISIAITISSAQSQAESVPSHASQFSRFALVRSRAPWRFRFASDRGKIVWRRLAVDVRPARPSYL